MTTIALWMLLQAQPVPAPLAAAESLAFSDRERPIAETFEGGTTWTGADLTLALFLISLPIYLILWICGVDLSK